MKSRWHLVVIKAGSYDLKFGCDEYSDKGWMSEQEIKETACKFYRFMRLEDIDRVILGMPSYE
jgi:hypothetical protein